MAILPKPPQLEDQIDELSERIRKLKIFYDLFFAGVRKAPPTFERGRVDNLIHELSRMRIRDNALRFKFNTVFSRYNQYRELWGRQMREREEGPLDFRRRQQAFEDADRKLADQESQGRTSARVTNAAGDPYVRVESGTNGDAIRQLYDQFEEMRKESTTSALSERQLAAMIEKQADALRSRYNVRSIAFRFEKVDGKVKLKAKPVQD